MTTDRTHLIHRSGRIHAGTVVLIALAAISGAAIGIAFRDRIATRLGLSTTQSGAAPVADAGQTGELWTCSMHPQVLQDKPGMCPICHMALTPVKASGAAAPASGGQGETAPPAGHQGPSITIDPAVVQNMGVRTATVTEGPLVKTVRAVGYLTEAQPNIRDVTLRISGWIERLYADTEGMRVEEGDPLFELYSPELQVAVEELIAARRARAAIGGDQPVRDVADSADTLVEAATRRLELWGLDRRQIDAFATLDRAPRTITFTSPISGIITEKPVVAGAAVKDGDRILRIVDLTTLWLDARVFEQDLPFVAVGEKSAAMIPTRPGERLEGEVVFVQPTIDPQTRTATVRVSVPNPRLELRPGMYARVNIESRLEGSAALAPREAVIDTGTRQVAFVPLGGGHFEARTVRMGLAVGDGMVQILEGLKPGESVVTSGQFLLDSESRLREAIQKFLTEKQSGGGSAPPPPPAEQGHGGHSTAPSQPASPPKALTSERQAQIDAVYAAYLALVETLGVVETTPTPVDPKPLLAAARTLRREASGDVADLGGAVARLTEKLEGKSADDQRTAFAPVSDAVIALARRYPPTPSVTDRLIIMHCPMAPGTWMQKTDDMANPYYPKIMKKCGEIQGEIAAAKAPAGEGR